MHAGEDFGELVGVDSDVFEGAGSGEFDVGFWC